MTKDVPIMRTQGRFPFVQDTELQCTAVAMPYVGADLDMVVVVPHRESSLTVRVCLGGGGGRERKGEKDREKTEIQKDRVRRKERRWRESM